MEKGNHSVEAGTQERVVRREDFGPTTGGDVAYSVVLSGQPCALFMDAGMREICGKPPIGTVDVDDGEGDAEFFPFCSEEHAETLKKAILDNLAAQGRYSVPGRNGFGREVIRRSEFTVPKSGK